MAQTNAEVKERKRERGRKYYLANREKILEKNRRYLAENRERIRQAVAVYQQSDGYQRSRDNRRLTGKDRAYSLYANHGLSLDDWLAIWDAQDGKCYLCGDALSSDMRKVHVDHYHGCRASHLPKKSCQFCRRGLACQPCNQAVGFAEDDPVRLRRMADNLAAATAEVHERQGHAPEQLTLT